MFGACIRFGILLFGGWLTLGCPSHAQEAGDFGKITDVLSKDEKAAARGMIDRYIQRRTDEFNAAHRQDWYKVESRAEWEQYRDTRIARLRQSLGTFPKPGRPNIRVTGTIQGEGYVIDNIIYESRPETWVPGNLYRPAKPGASMPGILIAHAHHRGKAQSELQDMGMTWARAGCLVLVIDQFGYGERRTHPFNSDADFSKPYKTSRQDYYFRHDTGIQLQLLGDSLMGWMAWDLMRGVDVLLAQAGIDPRRIILLGAVAGGGDVAGVTAALDPRIACTVPFNFGGPQPETKYPLPDDAETSFNYLLFTYWDSTRGLRLGASGDFPHWVIVASTAPRYLIHGHEFSWDGQRDPVWKRYQKIWGDFYGQADHLGVAHGKGLLKLNPPAASHCNNIGEFHRRMIHPLFEKWFGIKAIEYSKPRPAADLACFTDKALQEIHPHSLIEVMSAEGSKRIAAARQLLAGKTPAQQRQILREEWSKLLGPTRAAKPAVVKLGGTLKEPVGGARIETIVLEIEPGITVPLILLRPTQSAQNARVVVGLAKAGKAGFLKERSADLEKLIKAGVTVILPDLSGTGETRSGTSAGKDSSDTDQSVHLQLFGETLLGRRLRDLRSILDYVRSRPDLAGRKFVLWGDSFAPVNGPSTNYKIPHGSDGWPACAQPLGGLLALLGALYEDDVSAVYSAGGLSNFQAVLTHYAVLIPHGDSVPGALTAGDLSDLAASLAGRSVRMESMVDHLNRVVPEEELRKEYARALKADSKTTPTFSISSKRTSPAGWLIK